MKKVLVIEDDHAIRDSIAQLLEFEGYAVVFAENGRIGLEQLKNECPGISLIILDLVMPVMDGFEFYSLFKQNKDWSSIPVILISADLNASLKAKELGNVDFLKKPLKINSLIELVKRHAGA